MQKETDEKLRSVKLETDQEKDNVNKSKREEISLWENRYEDKKKAMKEIEAIFSAKVNELEKTKYISQEKLATSELKREECEKKSQIEFRLTSTPSVPEEQVCPFLFGPPLEPSIKNNTKVVNVSYPIKSDVLQYLHVEL